MTKDTVHLTYAEACRPIEKINKYMQKPQIPTGLSALEILQHIQKRLKTIESAHQWQASQLEAIMLPRAA